MALFKNFSLWSKKQSVADSRAHWLEETEHSLAEARFDAEFHNSQVAMLEGRKARLLAEIAAAQGKTLTFPNLHKGIF